MSLYKVLILDVDGVMTDGKFYYSDKGKVMKVFGADDNDALSLLKEYIKIIFVSILTWLRQRLSKSLRKIKCLAGVNSKI